MRNIDAEALSAFVGDLRSTLHKEQSTFKAMTQSEFEIKDNMLLNFQYAIDNAPTVEEKSYAMGFQDGLEEGLQDMRPQGEWIRKGDSKWHCSNCGAVPEFDGTTNTDKFNVTMSNKYCRLCGANMRKGGTE